MNISDGLFVILILDRNSKPYYCSPLCQLVFHRFSYQPKLALPTMDEISSDPEIMDSEYIENPEEVDTDTALSPDESFDVVEKRSIICLFNYKPGCINIIPGY